MHYALSNEPKMNGVRCLKPPKRDSKTQSGRFSYKSGSIVWKINAFSFLAPTTFGAEYCLTQAITHHPSKTDPPCDSWATCILWMQLMKWTFFMHWCLHSAHLLKLKVGSPVIMLRNLNSVTDCVMAHGWYVGHLHVTSSMLRLSVARTLVVEYLFQELNSRHLTQVYDAPCVADNFLCDSVTVWQWTRRSRKRWITLDYIIYVDLSSPMASSICRSVLSGIKMYAQQTDVILYTLLMAL